RLSLIVYFLVLLALALGSVSLLAYQTTQQSLLDKKETTETLLKDRYKHRCQDENDRLDKHLLQRAQHLASLAQDPFGRNRFQKQKPFAVGMLGAALNPQGHLFLALWSLENGSSPLAFRLHRTSPVTVPVRESEHMEGIEPFNLLSVGLCPQNLLLAPLWTPE